MCTYKLKKSFDVEEMKTHIKVLENLSKAKA